MLKFRLDIFLCYIITDIEASRTGTCVTLSADVTTGLFLLLVLIQSLRSLNRQITIFQGNRNLFFLKSRTEDREKAVWTPWTEPDEDRYQGNGRWL